MGLAAPNPARCSAKRSEMRKLQVIIITGFTLIFVGFLIIGCCPKGDNACYKAWYGLEPHPTKSGVYTDPFDRFFHPELRNISKQTGELEKN